MVHNTIGKYLLTVVLVPTFLFLGTAVVLADEEEDLAAMQRALNKEVLERPFNPGDKAAVDQYVEDALKKNEIPKPYAGKDWKKGYTCNNLRYSLSRYRSCRHYYRHYGYYYPY
ncbi:MAG: hypothetical protein ACPGYT_10385 [Nitrospirales bacterium]